MKTSTRYLCLLGVLMCSGLMAQSPAYTVKAGDSLARIAKKHGCTPAELAAANRMKLNALIHPGQNLKLPGTAAVAQDAQAKPATPSTDTSAAAPKVESHTIKAGETLSSVSRRYKVSLDSLLAANPGIKPNTLKVGQKIRIGAAEPTMAVVAEKSEPAPAAKAPVAKAPAAKAPVAPAPEPAPVKEQAAAAPAPEEPEAKIRSVLVDSEITYGEFAARHATDVVRLNDLNGLDLNNSTVLAKGSELYVQAHP